MSWSIGATDTKEKALEIVREQVANAYYKPGTPEGDDIVAAAARIEALANALAPAEKVVLSAYGSHSVGANGLELASFSVSVAHSK